MIFMRQNRAVIKVDPYALKRMRGHAQHREEDLEAGGVLLGRHLRDVVDVVVDDVTEPLEGDAQGRTFFKRLEGHQSLVDAAWRRSKGTCVYLGEWHTHPEDTPNPSRIDRVDWLRRLREDVVDAESLFFVIVGRVDVRAWEGVRGQTKLFHCKEIR